MHIQTTVHMNSKTKLNVEQCIKLMQCYRVFNAENDVKHTCIHKCNIQNY